MARRDEDEDELLEDEDDYEDEEVDGSRLTRLLGWGGLGVAVLGTLIRLFADRGSELRVAGAVVAVLGVAALFAGRLRAGREESDERAVGYEDDGAADDPKRTLRLVLAGLSGLFVLIGVGLVVNDALSGEETGNGWPFVVFGAIGGVASGIWHAAIGSHPREVAVGPPEPPSRRRWIAAAAGAAVLLGALTPMRYYLGDDIFDERFSWRMFSAVRVYSCELAAYETTDGAERQTPLMETIHVAWVNTMRRNREAVMQRYLEWRCEQPSVESARVVNRCTTPEGNRVPDVVRRIDCSVGDVQAISVELETDP